MLYRLKFELKKLRGASSAAAHFDSKLSEHFKKLRVAPNDDDGYCRQSSPKQRHKNGSLN